MQIRPEGAELFHADGRTQKRKNRLVEANGRLRDFVNDRKLLLSAPSCSPAVGPFLQIKDRTALLNIMNQSLTANMIESNNFNPFKTDTANNLTALFVRCSLINQRAPLYVKVGRPRPFIFLIRILLIRHEYGTLVER